MVKAFVQGEWHSVSNRFTLIVRSVLLLWRGDVGSWKMTCQDVRIYKSGKSGCIRFPGKRTTKSVVGTDGVRLLSIGMQERFAEFTSHLSPLARYSHRIVARRELVYDKL
jgi:hypothetical protein